MWQGKLLAEWDKIAFLSVEFHKATLESIASNSLCRKVSRSEWEKETLTKYHPFREEEGKKKTTKRPITVKDLQDIFT